MDRHLIQATLHLAESCCSVRFEVRSPAQQRLLGEDQVCPGEDREEMASQRVKPWRTERGEDTTMRVHESPHGPEDLFRIVVVLEPVHGEDDVRPLGRVRGKDTAL